MPPPLPALPHPRATRRQPAASAAYAAWLETRGPAALLESTGRGPLGRRSLLARDARAVLEAGPEGNRLKLAGGERKLPGDALDALRATWREAVRDRWPDEGGLVGALAYDFARPRPGAHGPWLIALAVDRLEFFDEPDDGAEPHASQAPAGAESELARCSSLTRDGYRGLVRRVQEHIAAGDIYQANLSQRFRRPFARRGLDLYDQLRRLNPAPFSGCLRAAGIEVVSASPERLLLADAGRVATRPIAGTRPRAADARRDAELRAELLLNEKERAEHLMLVDLARNDLGRVAAVGSVQVDELMAVEEYAHVRHIVSNVSARLAPGRDALDALRALFPGGTITGVPKLRCMQILDRLEELPRGFYTGALFYLTASGRLDANILIRSAVVADGQVTFHAGGGIVADSDPEREYEETLCKAEGMRRAVEAALEAPPLRVRT